MKSSEIQQNPTNESLDASLLKLFGHKSFRPGQREVVSCLLGGNSALVIMSTGAGKSLCYQLPSQMLPGLTLVFSPLIALMKDQVDGLRKHQIQASHIDSSLSRAARLSAYESLAQGKIKILYVTPERFKKSDFRQALANNQISLMVVDEAHCISQWGNDFRPDYSRLGEIRSELGDPPTVALTATATPEIRHDILRQLHLEQKTSEFVFGIERNNLSLHVHDLVGLDEKIRCIVGLRHQILGSAVIYFSLISTLEKAAHELSRMNLPLLRYHGQLSDEQRKRNQEKFLRSSNGLMLATPAFGLGVDKADIRLVIHAELPGSLEAYYQEIGRAGRDEKDSQAHLLFDQDDISIQADFIRWTTPDPGFIQGVFNLLQMRRNEIVSEGIEYLRQQMNFYNSRDFRVETTLNLLERWGVLDWENRDLKNYRLDDALPEELRDEVLYDKRLKSLQKGLLAMVQYSRDENCRLAVIYRHFGVKNPKACGRCDNCLKKN